LKVDKQCGAKGPRSANATQRDAAKEAQPHLALGPATIQRLLKREIATFQPASPLCPTIGEGEILPVNARFQGMRVWSLKERENRNLDPACMPVVGQENRDALRSACSQMRDRDHQVHDIPALRPTRTGM
jgi:hypothetical protein